VRAGVSLLSCLALATNAGAQVVISDAPSPRTLAPDALVVAGDSASCFVPSTLSLAAIGPRGSTTGIASRQTGSCRWSIEGLAAGSYEIALVHARGSGGRVRFDYVPGQLRALAIPAPAVTVGGIVRINGEPVADATIMFMTKPIQNGLIRVTTNADGSFEAWLPEAGDVGARLDGSTVYGQSVRQTFTAGSNRVVGPSLRAASSDARGTIRYA
jgi:hypothetical protein